VTRVLSTTHLFHYALDTGADMSRIAAEGLRPLSDFPESERWREIEAQAPGFFERLYRLVAEPVLGRPYERSGIFLTQVDFRQLPGSLLERRSRLTIPNDRIDASAAVLTWSIGDERVSRPFGPESLEEAASLWDAGLVTDWFARDRTRLFFHVPQVATYQPRVSTGSADVDPGPAAA
jgi:hypothetical protein